MIIALSIGAFFAAFLGSIWLQDKLNDDMTVQSFNAGLLGVIIVLLSSILLR
jgi:hypothetical protein